MQGNCRMRGDNCFNRRKKGTVVSQVERKGLQFCIEFDLQAPRMSEYVTSISNLPWLVWPPQERGAACHGSGVLDRASPANWRPHTICPESPPECKPSLLRFNSIFTYHPQLFQPTVLTLLLVTAVPNFRGNALANFA